MAATAVNVAFGASGGHYVSIDDITFDASPASGYSVAGIIPLNTVLGMAQVGGNAAALGYGTSYTVPTGTAKTGTLYVTVCSASGSVQAIASSSLAAVTIRMRSDGY